MQSRISVEVTPEEVAHLVIEVEPDAPGEAVASALAKRLGVPFQFTNREATTWAEFGPLEGAVLPVAENYKTGSSLPEAVFTLALAQVSGIGAGTVRMFDAGDFTLGSDKQCTIVLEDTDIPGVAALIKVGADGECTVTNTSNQAVLFLEGQQVTDTVTWAQGHSLRIGSYVFEVLKELPLTASVSPSEQLGLLDFNRPPRLLPKPRETDFKFPTEPEPSSRGALPLIGMFVPLLLAIVLATVMQRPYFLIFGLMSPVMMLAGYLSNRKNGKVTYRERKAKYRKVQAQVEEDVHVAVVDFANEQRTSSPDPAMAGLIAALPSPRLWERRRADTDHLSLRVGVSEVQSDVSVYHPEEVNHRRTQFARAQEVPVTVSLRDFGVVGVCGQDELVHRNAAWLIAQLAVAQSPRDISFVILTDKTSQLEWEWVRWLPHASGSSHAVSSVGNDTRTVGQRLNELSQIIEARQKNAPDANPHSFRSIVVVFDGVRKLRQWPGAPRVLIDGPAVGVHSICLDAEERLLPEESSAIITCNSQGGTLKRDRQETLEGITLDIPNWEWFDWIARAIAPIRDVSDETDSAIPTSARFLDTVVMPDPDATSIIASWETYRRTTSAVIGESFDGAFDVDLRKDGPHVLIAGTTGSGKSELLQTLIASLALRNRPDELSFVLIDYKGNAAFKDFVDLPHTVGIVTDLDGHLVQRAMDSLAAELRRREHLLASVGAKDIEDFTAARERGDTANLMPRLVLVIDEFAALKAELPEFVAGIVNIAQRGRSLGIHLVMATQRPQGAITADILANTNLRIALRMADPLESKDVIGTADAAEISTSTPGRAYVKSGSSPLLPFQSARIGGARPTAHRKVTDEPVIHVVPWSQIGYPLPATQKQKEAESAVTDLQVLVAAMKKAAQQLGIPSQPSPWLPSLNEHLLLADLDSIVESVPDEDLPLIPFGLQDFPSDQSQRPLCLDFREFSHLFIVGSPRSGRTQALRTIAGSIGGRVSPRDVHLYGVDFGNGGLHGILQLPHCNTVISRNQSALLTRFINRLEREISHRRALLAQDGFASIYEQRKNVPSNQKLPHMVVLFDQWEGFLNGIGDNCQSVVGQSVLSILREGASVGVHLVIAGDRSLLASRTNTLVEHKLLMRLADRADYTMANLSPRELPEKISPGRAFAAVTARETQFALLDADTSSQAQVTALRLIAENALATMGDIPEEQLPMTMRDLASKVTFAELMTTSPVVEPFKPLIGVGGDDVEPLAINLVDIPTFIVGGSSRAGKSTALKAMVKSSLESGVQVALLTPLRSPLRDLANHPGVVASYEGAGITPDAIREILGLANALVVVDDASAITDYSLTEELKKLAAPLNAGNLKVIAADGFDEWDRVGGLSWLNELVKRRHGALLDPPTVFSGKPFGLSLNQDILAQPRPVGRALVNLGDGRVTFVQIACEG